MQGCTGYTCQTYVHGAAAAKVVTSCCTHNNMTGTNPAPTTMPSLFHCPQPPAAWLSRAAAPFPQVAMVLTTLHKSRSYSCYGLPSPQQPLTTVSHASPPSLSNTPPPPPFFAAGATAARPRLAPFAPQTKPPASLGPMQQAYTASRVTHGQPARWAIDHQAIAVPTQVSPGRGRQSGRSSWW